MGTREKLIERFCSLPKDFSFDEMVRLLQGFGYTSSNKGKTSGSRVRFMNKEAQSIIDLHKPHPGNILKMGAMKDVLRVLEANGFIETNKK